MPILRQHHVAEPRCKTVDDGNDLVALRHRQRTARTKIVLHIDDDEHAIVAEPRVVVHTHYPVGAPCGCWRRSTSAASATSSGATSTGYVASSSKRRKASGRRSSSRRARALIASSGSG